MKKWLRNTSILSLVALTSVPAWAVGEPDVASSDPLAPRIMVPEWTADALPEDIDPWVRKIVADETAEHGAGDALLEAVAIQMLARYDLSGMSDEEQAQRFLSIASGEAAADYEKSQISEMAVRFSKDSFEGFAEAMPAPMSSAEENPEKARTDAEFLAFLASPEGVKTLSMMSGDQIKAIAALVSAMRSELPPEQLFGAPSSTFDGVPELSSDPSATDVAELVKSMTAPQEAQAPAVRDVGDGKNLLLAGWTARETSDQGVEIYNPTIEGSALPVSEGMILGPFGPVAAIERSGSAVTVIFASGEQISNGNATLDQGVPALAGADPDISGQVNTGGEFLLSALPAVPAAAETRDNGLDADLAQADDPAGSGLASSPRPKPRPASLSAPAQDVAPTATASSIRPKPRPDTLVVATAESSGTSDMAPKSSLRPKPRPKAMPTQNGGT